MAEDTWEYRVEMMGGLFRSFNIEWRVRDTMNHLGSEGWELVAFERSWLGRRYCLVFQRRCKAGAH